MNETHRIQVQPMEYEKLFVLNLVLQHVEKKSMKTKLRIIECRRRLYEQGFSQ